MVASDGAGTGDTFRGSGKSINNQTLTEMFYLLE